MACVPVVLDTRVVSGTGGGPDKTILNSPRFLAPDYRNICAYMHPPNDPGFEQLRLKADAWQAPLRSVPDRGPWDWRVVARMLEICRQEKVDIWHGHDYKTNALGLLLRPFHRMRLVTTVHGWVKNTRRTPLYYAIDRLCLPRYEKVVCVSQDLYDQCRACGVPAQRCVLIENGIDTAEFVRQRDAAEAKKQLGFPPERQLIGAVGRISAEKGFDLLIKAVDHLVRQGRDLGLWIVGEGDQEKELNALIAQLGQQDRIRLLGYRSDLKAIYEALDIFTLSSLREGLPNVVLEALAMETPVVATRIAGVPRLVRHEENGLLIEPGSVGELTQALTRLLDDYALRERFRKAGRRIIEADYSFAVRMDKMRAVYDSILRSQPGTISRSASGVASAPRESARGADATPLANRAIHHEHASAAPCRHPAY